MDAEQTLNEKFFFEKIIFRRGFWIGVVIFLILIAAYMHSGEDKVIEVVQRLWK